MKERKREEPAIRKQQILDAGIKMATKHGYQSITREDVASAADVSVGLVSKYFLTMANLKRAIMRAAIDREILSIVAQGVSLRDPLTRSISGTLRLKMKALFD